MQKLQGEHNQEQQSGFLHYENNVKIFLLESLEEHAQEFSTNY